MSARGSRIGLGCSVLAMEIESLRSAGRLSLDMIYLDSMLHMDPSLLAESMDQALGKARERGDEVLLVYGECQPFIGDLVLEGGVSRVQGTNCIELLLGRKSYRELLREGVFFVLPEWSQRWLEVMGLHLGLDARTARDLMGEMHTRILYLDTGVIEVPWTSLRAMSAYTGLEFEVRRTGLELLAKALAEAMSGVGACP